MQCIATMSGCQPNRGRLVSPPGCRSATVTPPADERRIGRYRDPTQRPGRSGNRVASTAAWPNCATWREFNAVERPNLIRSRSVRPHGGRDRVQESINPGRCPCQADKARTPKTYTRAKYAAAQVNVDVCVVGGGPGGSATATNLAQLGLSVVLVDRVAFPREVLWRWLDRPSDS